SPVRYIRDPGTPNGHATNRDPVNPARPQYPTPTPRPATYNSPTTPTGTGRNHASSTNTATVGGGAPIGGTPNPTDPGAIGAPLAASAVAPVGPYPLITPRPGAHAPPPSAGHASPPSSSAPDSNPCGSSAATADGVCVSTLTPSAISKAC